VARVGYPEVQVKQATYAAYYRPSGKVAPYGVLTAALCGCAVLPGAMLYAWVCLHAPALVRLLGLGLFALSIAVVVDWAVIRARVRSGAWVGRFGVALALCSWSVQWVWWAALGMPHDDAAGLWRNALAGAGDPGLLLEAAWRAAQLNVWELHPVVLACGWVGEAWLLLQGAALLGRQRARRPYCEASGAWADEIVVPRRFAAIAHPDAIVQVLERAPEKLSAVLAPCAATLPGADAAYTEVALYRCSGGEAYVSLCHVVVQAGKHGRRRAQEWLTALRLSAMDIDALLAQLIARADAPADEAAEAQEAAIAPVLASALALYQAARFADAYVRAQPHTGAGDGRLRVDANRLCALACVRQGRWDAAVTYWSAVFDDEPSAATALQLAASGVLAGDLPVGQAWFQRARTMNAARGELPPLTLLTTFVSALDQAGQQQAAMPWLDAIRECYCNQGVTDPTALFANRMPLFHEFLDRSAPIVFAALGGPPGLRWFAAMLGHLDEAGHAALRQWIDEQARSIAG
jgi:hypothetical protein